MNNQFDLSGKNVVITGGSGFLGMHFALGIAEMGGIPILIDIDKTNLEKAIHKLKEEGHNSFAYELNICNCEEVNILFDKIFKLHKSVDCLVNAAAFAMKNLKREGAEYFAPFEDYLLKKLASIDVNLNGTFW